MGLNSGDKGTDHAIAGAASGFITRLLCQPLDVIKIRFQLQVEPISHSDVSKYRSFTHGVSVIIKEEGVLALWKGHVPAQLLSIVYGISQFCSYNEFKKYSCTIGQLSEWEKTVNFAAGAAAGGVATVISFPFDTVRTRLVAQSSNNEIYQGVIHPYVYEMLSVHLNSLKELSRTILRTESPRSFFRGLLPTLLQIAPHTGLQFMFYALFIDAHKRYHENAEKNIVNSMLAGGEAGLLAKTIVYPFDLARKRLQIQGFEHGRKGFGKFFSCRGLVDCVARTLRVEGFRGLFKGLAPSQLKAAVTTAFHFTAYEQVLLMQRELRKSASRDI